MQADLPFFCLHDIIKFSHDVVHFNLVYMHNSRIFLQFLCLNVLFFYSIDIILSNQVKPLFCLFIQDSFVCIFTIGIFLCVNSSKHYANTPM